MDGQDDQFFPDLSSTYKEYRELLSPTPVTLWTAHEVEHLIASLEPDYPALHLHGEVKPFRDHPHLACARLYVTSDLSDSVYGLNLQKVETRYEPSYLLTVGSRSGGLTTDPGRSCRQVETFSLLGESGSCVIECPTERDALDACTEMETKKLSDLQMFHRMAERVEARHAAEPAHVSAPTSATEASGERVLPSRSTPLHPSNPYLHYTHEATPAEALLLGVPGTGPAANQRRLELADQLSDEGYRLTDAAYAAATWPHEPEVPKPFGLELLRHHGGDVLAVVASREFRAAVEEHLGYGWQEVLHNDEDGKRFEWEQVGASRSEQQLVDETVREITAGVQRRAAGLPALDNAEGSVAHVLADDRPDPPDRAAGLGLNR